MAKIPMADVLERVTLHKLKRGTKYNSFEHNAAVYKCNSLEDAIIQHYATEGWIPALVITNKAHSWSRGYYYVPLEPVRRMIITRNIIQMVAVPEIA